MRIHLYSLHGLFRANRLELGRDADNGGQIIYVMELAKALSRRPEVEKVHLFTRRIDDPAVGPEYARPVEEVNPKLDIRRVWCGGKRYLPKEKLWDCLDEFVTNALTHIKAERIFPDWIHSHYADAGYVATELSSMLNVPFAHTGHSLGRPKLEKLVESGMSREEAYARFQFLRRLEAEEETLANAEFIVASTEREIRAYEGYRNFDQAEFHVIPPGIDFDRFYPYYQDLIPGADLPEERRQALFRVKENVEKFFAHPDRPFILAICRPDRKKNIDGLIHAYGTDRELQAIANLAVFAGIRRDIAHMPPGEKEVLTEILLLMDKYNLYGRLAIPKKHDAWVEVPEIYRLCASKRGVFVNIALTEPFGLTLLEAGACGLPAVATNDGGPAEILRHCGHGLLVDPRDTAQVQEAIKRLLVNEELWTECSNRGVRAVQERYSWEVHAERYLRLVEENREASQGLGVKHLARNRPLYERLRLADRMLITDIDGTLLSEGTEQPGLEELRRILAERDNRFVFGVATGRSLPLVREALDRFQIPAPDVVIASVGTYIYYSLDEKFIDKGWLSHIKYQWKRGETQELLLGIPGLELQEEANQNPFKISFYVRDPALTAEVVRERLGRRAKTVNVLLTQGLYLDVLPKRASKGRAVRYVGNKWSIPLSRAVVCGDSGNDMDMFTGSTRGVVVGNYAPELEPLRNLRKVYFAQSPSAAGILEGLRRYNFLEG